MLYWLTATAGSSARIYYEGAHAGGWGAPERSTVPTTGVAVFSEDISRKLCQKVCCARFQFAVSLRMYSSSSDL
jgi:hypothetical protein